MGGPDADSPLPGATRQPHADRPTRAGRPDSILFVCPHEIRVSKPPPKSKRDRRLRVIFFLLAIFLGGLDAWSARHAITPDGISYLDMGDAYVRRDWGMAVNGLWSPLYSWLLGLAMLILKPSPYWEVAVAHIVNFVIYLCALCCFDFLLRELLLYLRVPAGEPAQVAQREPLPAWAWFARGIRCSSGRLLS